MVKEIQSKIRTKYNFVLMGYMLFLKTKAYNVCVRGTLKPPVKDDL